MSFISFRLDSLISGFAALTISPGKTASAESTTQSSAPPTIDAPKKPRRNNIERGESWSYSFHRKKPDLPSEIQPGLYLGNAKTAAAYLTGRLDGDSTFPAISHIVTILANDYERYGFDTFPDPAGSGTRIRRLVIEKLDNSEANLMGDFDRACEFIEKGMQAYLKSLNETAHRPFAHKSEAVTRVATVTAPGAMFKTVPKSIAKQLPEPDPVTTLKPANKPKATAGVLVHCHAGVSRSSTIIIAYLLKNHSYLFKNVDEDEIVYRAIQLVRTKRSIINPNPSFRRQLGWYINRLDCSTTDPKTGKIKDSYLDVLDDFEDSKYVSITQRPGV